MKTLLALLCLSITHLHAQDFDRYGGSTAIKGKATGWFHLEEVKGRWFFITPEGHGFIPIGVNHLGTYFGGGAQKLRPSERDLVKERHHGSVKEAAVHVEKLVRSWGFNYAGYDAPAQIRQTMPFSTGFKQTNTSGVTVFGPPEYVDVFAPAFAADLDKRVAELCGPLRANRFLLGYYLVDLPRWGDMAYLENEEKKQGVSWLTFFRTLPTGSPGRLAYEKAVSDAADLKAAELAFTVEIADQCYRLTVEAFRRHDPNHLVLGERFAGERLYMPVVECSAKYFPVIATQRDGSFDASFYRNLHQRTGKPIINADHVANFITPVTQKVLGRALKNEAESAALYASISALLSPSLTWSATTAASSPPEFFKTARLRDGSKASSIPPANRTRCCWKPSPRRITRCWSVCINLRNQATHERTLIATLTLHCVTLACRCG